MHPCDCTPFAADADDAVALEDLDAAHASALGEGLRDGGRVGGAVAREPEGAEDVVDLHGLPHLLRLRGADDVRLDAEGAGAGAGQLKCGHAVLVARKSEAAAAFEAGGEAGLCFECSVEFGAVAAQSGFGFSATQLSNQSCSMPSCTSCKLSFFFFY